MRRWLGTMAVIALAATGCGDNGDTDPSRDSRTEPDESTWPGRFLHDVEVQIGEWEGAGTQVKVTCSGDPESTATATLEAPGFTATTTQPEGGGPAPVTVTGPDRTVTWDAQGRADTVPDQEPDDEDAVTWGVTPTFTSGSLDEYPAKDGTYFFDLNEAEVDCADETG